jgi:flagellar hook-associated protein 2
MSSINLLNSGLDVSGTVDKLIYVEEEPVRQLQTQSKTLSSKVSAFNSLNSKVSSLLTAVNDALYQGSTAPLSPVYSFEDRLATSVFGSRTVNSSNSDVVSGSAGTGMSTGTYSIEVSQLAQARTVAGASFADIGTTHTGTGTLVFRVGTKDPVTVSIDSTNNTLEGVRRAINAANAGVTATIVNDGSGTPYRLSITANGTGTTNSFTVTDNLSGGQALTLAETMAARDAQFTVNGMNITKSTNTVTDVVEGVTFNLKAKTTSPVVITVEKDTDSIVSNIKDLVKTFNDVNSFANSQFKYDETKKTAGVLSGDTTLRTAHTKLRDILSQTVANSYTSFRNISQVGIEFNDDGSITVDETKLREAIDENPREVAALFLGNGTAGTAETASLTDARATYQSKTSATQSGTYNIAVTALATQARITSSDVVTALLHDERLTIGTGSTSTIVDLIAGDTLSSVLTKINDAFDAQGIDATASDDGTGRIRITTTGYGSSESLSVVSTASGAGSTGFGTTPLNASGTDIQGTINGHAATGSGTVLTGATGQAEEGLSLQIAQTTTGSYGSVTFTQAVAGQEGSSILTNLRSYLKNLTDSSTGAIHNSTEALNKTIEQISDRIDDYEARLDVRRELLTNEYSRADQALRLMSVTQSSLASLLS